MRDKLIKLFQGFNFVQAAGQVFTKEDGYEQLADYLLSNGVIVPPVTVGDVIYVISPLRRLEEKKVTGIEQSGTKTLYIRCFGSAYPNFLIGKTVFLAREEAERALEQRRENNDA